MSVLFQWRLLNIIVDHEATYRLNGSNHQIWTAGFAHVEYFAEKLRLQKTFRDVVVETDTRAHNLETTKFDLTLKCVFG